MSIALRIIASPFMFMLLAIMNVYITIKGTFMFLMHGGEFMIYTRDSRPTIATIYTELKKNQTEQ